MSDLKKVEIFTDGSCSGNPGPGGWGAVLRYKGHEIEISGGESLTTNNRMELTALIEALKRLKERCEIVICTDSKYIVDAFKQGWIFNWIKNGWKKADKKPVLNAEMWQELYREISKHEYSFIWVKGHAGHPENERCDKMATDQTAKFSKEA